MSDTILQLAETIQTASINRHPDPARDINPSTSASNKQPVEFSHASRHDSDSLSDVDEDEIPLSALRPVPRRSQLPPLPDLRFEQSYLSSIQHAESWQRVAYITFRDQVFMPLTQGLLWTLVLAGWRHWNSTAQYTGHSVGARIRRWWYRTNNWKLPVSQQMRGQNLARNVKEIMLINLKHYQAQFSDVGAD